MKKLLVFILCLASTTLFADDGLHYVINELGVQGTHTTVTGVFALDGEEIFNGEGMQEAGGEFIEIGVFDQDGECRGAKFPVWRAKSNQWIYILKLRGDVGFTYPTFKVYNHATETEYEYELDINETIVWTSNGKYGSTTAPYLINFTDPSSPSGYTLDIEGYGEDNANTNLGYYLIASPVMEEVHPSSENGFVTDNYDLYYFDQGQDLEWVNFKDQYNGDWPVVNGKGYLYASKTNTTLTFAGNPQITESTVPLEWKDWAEFPGLNLIGNPFPVEAYADRGYYRMNPETRDGLIPAGVDESVGAMEGIFVVAEEEGETVTFSEEAPGKLGTKLILNLRPNTANTVIDRAIVNFEQSQELPKLEILNRNSKIYFQKDNQDLATLNAGGMGEIPFCFKAEKNGTFTLSFNSKEVTFSYLHLIDNKTGVETDLLQTPSYSFDALTTDYANRFSLVFATGSSVDGDNFSFVNTSGNLCIYGIDGEATLQVVDVLGHVLSSETFSGSYEKKLSVAPGVYMLRLIQGNDVKVQKTVIK